MHLAKTNIPQRVEMPLFVISPKFQRNVRFPTLDWMMRE